MGKFKFTREEGEGTTLEYWVAMNETELTNFFAVIAPNLPNEIERENLSPEIEKRCVPKSLGVKVYLDNSLKRFQTVFPAAGSSNSAIEMNLDELEKYSNSIEWIDVTREREQI